LIFRERHVAYEAERLDDAAPGPDRWAGRVEILFGARKRRQAHAFHRFVFGRDLEARDRLAETFLEIAPPQLAVGEDGKSDRLLPGDHVADRVVLGTVEFAFAGSAALVIVIGTAQVGRRAQPAHLIDAKFP
jgi:hypothetical protein